MWSVFAIHPKATLISGVIRSLNLDGCNSVSNNAVAAFYCLPDLAGMALSQLFGMATVSSLFRLLPFSPAPEQPPAFLLFLLALGVGPTRCQPKLAGNFYLPAEPLFLLF